MKANIDNRRRQTLSKDTMKAKSQLMKAKRSQEINIHNGMLLDRIYRIFTRERPSVKGFDEEGKP